MCGIIGINPSPDAAEEVFLGLQNLQHRGQDGGGIVTLTLDGTFHAHRGPGLLDIAFPPENFARLHGPTALGHTRYTTTGSKDPELLQPFVSRSGGVAIAHNGNIVNFHPMRAKIQAERPEALQTGSDSELILDILVRELQGKADDADALPKAVQALSSQLIGAYSVVGLSDKHGMFAFRDPNGLRPLVLGTRQEPDGKVTVAFASESAALEFLGFTDIESLAAGELAIAQTDGNIRRMNYRDATPTHCMFEWVYFARVESNIDNLSVYEARFNLGLQLAAEVRRRGLTPDIVVPVPETSRIAAIALAEGLGVPFREVLIKNRYVNRTFILDSQRARQEAIRRKLYPVAQELVGKKILMVDDSIVRGNTAIQIVRMLRKSGAEAVYLASTCPPIKNPCYYGIDFPSHEELLAGKYSEAELTDVLGVDALVYQSMEGLQAALQPARLCAACLTGEYPTDISAGEAFAEIRVKDRADQVTREATLNV